VTKAGEAGKQSVDEIAGSLTGFDEIAIQQMFRGDMSDLSPTMTARALVFVLKRREGLSDKDAYSAVMHLPLGEVNDSFGIEGDDEAGKD
jgi:hypothetical protein